MAFSVLARLKIARRISNAETKLLGMLSDDAGTKSLLPYSGWTDEKQVLHDCIAPRLRRLRSSFCGPPQRYPALDWWGLAWILGLWRGERSASMIEHSHVLENIELMLNLVGNHDSFKPEFWAEIAQWQLRMYKELCTKFLEDYCIETARYTAPDDEYVQSCCSAVKTAVQRVMAEPEPSPENVMWTDVFATHIIFHDPTLHAVIEAEPVLEGRPDGLDIMIEHSFHQQPCFPPACHALEFK
ncbi:hypothetical protein FRC00_001668 [Tulasnella sp. 408]|nr:hypothetical protein FRC00_001668 [Tulasnella sp. 408]